jgi:hypothetical protein
VGDDDQPTLVPAEKPRSQVIESASRWLVGSSRQQGAAAGAARVGEEDPGQLDPAALAAGEGAERLAEHAVLQARGWHRSGPPRPRRRSRPARRTGPRARRTGRISLSSAPSASRASTPPSCSAAARPARGRRAPGRGR